MTYHNPDLEFETLVAQIGKRCHSDLGKEQASLLAPIRFGGNNQIPEIGSRNPGTTFAG